jgi:hypothetical protein
MVGEDVAEGLEEEWERKWEEYEVVQDLLADDLCGVEGGSALDRVDDHVAMDADEVLGVQVAVLILELPTC